MTKINFEKLKNKGVTASEPDFSVYDGKHLRQMRMNMNMSQAVMADYLGVSKKAIEKWEQGVNPISATIARFLMIIEKMPEVLSLIKQIKVNGNEYTYKRFYFCDFKDGDKKENTFFVESDVKKWSNSDNVYKLDKNSKKNNLSEMEEKYDTGI